MALPVPYEPLTPREREILTLLSQNLSDREIAERLFLGLTTVKWYNRQIFKKLGVKNRKDAIRQGAAMGLLDSSGTKPTPKHNLPAALTPFIGRSEELAELRRFISHPHTRLVTILAPGGMGKTRLALEAAEAMLDQYADGVFFVPLAGLTSSDHFISTLADSLGLQFAPDGRTPQQQLFDFLRRKHLLLILDNFEHLLDSAPLVAALLVAASQVKALITSRERLGMTGEVVYPLAGLHYPADSADDPLRFGAVQLFVECALRASPHFRVHDAASMGRVCRLVQGMPLAIELAGALAGTLSTAEIAAEISRSVDFLHTIKLRDMPERLRSVRAVFEAAWARLDDDARRAFRRMSVFRGGCTREAAQAVTDGSLATLAALVDNALLWRNPHTERYEVHELLRQYAEQELEKAGELESARQAHQDYYAALTATWGAAMMLDKVEEGLAIFDADIENVRVAFARASERAIPTEVEPFADLWLYYDLRGKFLEGLAEFAAACDLLEQNDSLALAKLLTGRAEFYNHLSRQSEAYPLSTRAVHMLRRLGGWRNLSLTMAIHGDLELILNGHRAAAPIFHEALAIAQNNTHPFFIAILLQHLAWVDFYMEKVDEATVKMTEAYQHMKKLNNLWGIPLCLHSLGAMLVYRDGPDDADEAQRWYTEALEISRKIGFQSSIGSALDGLAGIACNRGDWETARCYVEEILQICIETGQLNSVLSVTCYLVDIACRLADTGEASRHLRRSIQLLSETADRQGLKYWAKTAGGYLIGTGEFMHAAVFLSYFDVAPDTSVYFGAVSGWTADNLAACRDALPPDVFAAAVERGKTLTVESAIAELMPFL